MSTGRFRIQLKGVPQGHFEQDYLLEGHFLARENAFDILGGTLQVHLQGNRSGDLYDLNFALKGTVQTRCTRCDMELALPIENHFHAVVKIGEEAGGDDDEEIIVARTNPTLELDDILYGFVVLAMPLRRTHEEGGCSEEIDAFFQTQDREQGSSLFAELLKAPGFASEKEQE